MQSRIVVWSAAELSPVAVSCPSTGSAQKTGDQVDDDGILVLRVER